MAISRAAVLETLHQKKLTCSNIQDYKTLDSVLHLKCERGHEFDLTFRTVRDDRWKCNACEGKNSLGVLFFGSEPPSKNGKRIVAIDNATRNIGIAVFDNGKLVHQQLVEFEGETIERMVANRNFIKNTVIKKWKPDLVVLEDIQSQKNVQTFKALAMLLGSTVVLLKENNIAYETVLSTQWRAHFMISGERVADKLQAIDKVMQMYGIIVADDVAEAILLGKYAVDAINTTKPIKLF
jgi:Holliday junction resolvasome RuvABC endonuclease subunit